MLFAFALITLLATSPVVAVAEANQGPAFERFGVEIDILPDGDFVVTETQVVAFGPTAAQQGFREIPLDRVTGIADVKISGPDGDYRRVDSPAGQPFTYSVQRENGVLAIDWGFPPTANQTRTFVLRYRVSGGLRIYPDGDQLYWDAIYADRPLPVDQAEVTVRLPAAVSSDQVLLGAYPEHLNVEQSFVEGQVAHFRASGLPAGTGLTVRVQFPHGLVAGEPPPWQAEADRADVYDDNIRPLLNLFLGVIALLIPLGGALGLLYLWQVRGRDPSIKDVPRVLTEPPSPRSPAVVGTLVDETADVQDVVATLVDLAERDVVRLADVKSGDLFGTGHDFEVELLAQDTSALLPFERTVIEALLPRGGKTNFSELLLRFELAIPHVRKALYEEVVRLRLFEADPESVRRRFAGLGTTILIGGLIAAVALGSLFGSVVDLIWAPFASATLVGLAMILVAPKMPRRTRVGALEAAQWRAFERHLRTIEQQRDLQGDTDTFERYLPYAIALGIDREWVAKFSTAGTPAPRWYRSEMPPVIMTGPGTFGGYPGRPGRMPRGPVRGMPGIPIPPANSRPGQSPRQSQSGQTGGGLGDLSQRGAGGLEGMSGSL
ncbi:MAG TPA: DUF2207 domain-containing protein, partial [Chloroflexota bacterium]|nr:DUF2207 domain-containing protein [Chloroflexota bacterium]